MNLSRLGSAVVLVWLASGYPQAAEIDVRRGEDGVLIAYQAGEAFQP